MFDRIRTDRHLMSETREMSWIASAPSRRAPDVRSRPDATRSTETVEQALGRLGPAWTVEPAVGLGGRAGHFDHLVIGPAGVFTLSAKSHPHAKVWVDGRSVRV